MDNEAWKVVNQEINEDTADEAFKEADKRDKIFQKFLKNKAMPEEGWLDVTIEYFVQHISLMDNNNHNSVKLFGQEGRVYSGIVSERNFNFINGIGGVTQLNRGQRNAAGSTLMFYLTNCMLEDLMKHMGIQSPVECMLVPLSLGMSLLLCLLALKRRKKKARYVIWSRVDQKACFKSIISSGCVPIIVEMMWQDEQLETNCRAIEDAINKYQAENIVCVLSTTSCPAPRTCDNIESIAKLCATYNLPHIINNSYGLQSKYCMRRIQKAKRIGRVDVFLQTADRNLMVPVGGTIFATFEKSVMEIFAETYPGKASLSPVIDVFITLLKLGRNGFLALVDERERMFTLLLHKLLRLAKIGGEKVFKSLDNPLSIALTILKYPPEDYVKLGSTMYLKDEFSSKIQTSGGHKIISGYEFNGWGFHCSTLNIPFITFTAGIGIKEEEIALFLKRLKKIMPYTDEFLL